MNHNIVSNKRLSVLKKLWIAQENLPIDEFIVESKGQEYICIRLMEIRQLAQGNDQKMCYLINQLEKSEIKGLLFGNEKSKEYLVKMENVVIDICMTYFLPPLTKFCEQGLSLKSSYAGTEIRETGQCEDYGSYYDSGRYAEDHNE